MMDGLKWYQRIKRRHACKVKSIAKQVRRRLSFKIITLYGPWYDVIFRPGPHGTSLLNFGLSPHVSEKTF